MADLSNIRIVLVEPIHSGNIGGVARAIKNMGITSLYLVRPKNFPSKEADYRSAKAHDILERAIICEHFEEAVEECSILIGTSVRNRRIKASQIISRDIPDILKNRTDENTKVAFIFGREDHGLDNEILIQCHYQLSIPTSAAYTSLNLAMAVQVVAYEVYLACCSLEKKDHLVAEKEPQKATYAEMNFYFEHLKEFLVEIDYFDPNEPRQTIVRLKRLFNRANLESDEVRMLHGVLREAQKKMKTACISPPQSKKE